MKKSNISLKNEGSYLLFILPALIIFSMFIIYPAISTIYHSFTNWTDMNENRIKFVGFKNYIRFFKDKTILLGIRNSFVFAFVATILQSVFGIILALLLDDKFKSKNILRAVYYFPAVLSTLIIGFLWNYMLSTSDFGLVNQIIQKLGFSKINFLGNGKTALMSIIGVAIWQWAGWTMTIYLANIQSIPTELYESADIDGAGGWKKFRYVTLPMLFPAVSFCVTMGIINGLKVFDLIYAMTNGGPGHSTESIITLMMKKGFTEGFYAYSCTMGTVFLCMVLILTGIQMKFMNKWGDSIS